MKTYEKAGSDVHEIVKKLVAKFHPGLAKVRFDLLFVGTSGEGAALSAHGYPAAACVRILGLRDRVAGRGDAEIQIDQVFFEGIEGERREALLDHELTHLEPKLDKQNKPKVDTLGRPLLKMRKHDHQLGWFDACAKRFGEASMEVCQARDLVERTGQTYFQFEDTPKEQASEATDSGEIPEDIIEQCIEVIRVSQRASVSILQRRLRIGYTAAARVMDILEERGIVGPHKGAEPRDILGAAKEAA